MNQRHSLAVGDIQQQLRPPAAITFDGLHLRLWARFYSDRCHTPRLSRNVCLSRLPGSSLKSHRAHALYPGRAPKRLVVRWPSSVRCTQAGTTRQADVALLTHHLVAGCCCCNLRQSREQINDDA